MPWWREALFRPGLRVTGSRTTSRLNLSQACPPSEAKKPATRGDVVLTSPTSPKSDLSVEACDEPRSNADRRG